MTETVRGRVWCFGDDISTDLIQPVHALLRPVEQQPRYVFEANRPGWVNSVERGDLIVAGRNFGTGSGRPAARVLADLGIAGVVCDSINGLFFRNCVNFAFPAMRCPGASAAFAEGDVATFDLGDGVVRNETSGAELVGWRWEPELLEIYRHGGLLERLRGEGLIAAEGA